MSGPVRFVIALGSRHFSSVTFKTHFLARNLRRRQGERSEQKESPPPPEGRRCSFAGKLPRFGGDAQPGIDFFVVMFEWGWQDTNYVVHTSVNRRFILPSNPPQTSRAPLRKRGRPTAEPKSDAVRVRLTPAEKKAFARLAARLKAKPATLLRRMVREAVTGDPDLFDDQLPAVADAANQLAAVGRNLNQLVRAVHRQDAFVDPITMAELEELTGAVTDLKSQVRRMVTNTRTRSLQLAGER